MKFKIGNLIYTKDVGYPFDRTDDGGESWEGVSAIVTKLNTGWDKSYIEITPIFPVKSKGGTMATCIFQPEQLRIEERPWLKKNLKKIVQFRNKIEDTRNKLEELLA